MAEIPLQKFREIEYPMTPKSTVHFWATEAYFKNRGPLAGRIKKILGRWYVATSNDDTVVEEILKNIRTLRDDDQNEI